MELLVYLADRPGQTISREELEREVWPGQVVVYEALSNTIAKIRTAFGDDPQQEYFADGMTDDLIMDLSKISGLLVIARNSTFKYKGTSPDVSQVSRELGVQYVLEGSVRRAGDQVRINAQLVDGTSGLHLWAERYDGTLSNIFALQDKVTEKIVAALSLNLTAQERALQARIETEVAKAHDAFLRGWAYYRQNTPDDFAEAIPYFKQAITLDPNYGRAYAALAAIHWSSLVKDGVPLVWWTAQRFECRPAAN